MESFKQKRRLPPVRYIVRADDGTGIKDVGRGVSKLAEIAWADKYANKTGYKVWIIDAIDGRTVYRVEGKARRAAGGTA